MLFRVSTERICIILILINQVECSPEGRFMFITLRTAQSYLLTCCALPVHNRPVSFNRVAIRHAKHTHHALVGLA